VLLCSATRDGVYSFKNTLSSGYVFWAFGSLFDNGGEIEKLEVFLIINRSNLYVVV